MKYHQLSERERYQIEAGIALGMSPDQIAKRIKRHRSTIFRELKRNARIRRGGYGAMSAQSGYDIRRYRRSRPKKKIRGNLKKRIDTLIQRKWSPEQISGRLKFEKKASVGVETIYRYLYEDRKNGGSLWKNLRHRRAKRRKRFPSPRWPKQIPRIPAENRPSAIQNRQRVGDFERDMIVGSDRRGFLLTVVDRKSKLLRIRKADHLKARYIHKRTIQSLRGLQVRSITNDNGVEFLRHDTTSKTLGAPIYFTRPYASWERGTVENTNKLIRQYFPKLTNFKEISYEKIKMVQNALNHRPRKTLGFRTPMEAYTEEILSKKPKFKVALDSRIYQKTRINHCPKVFIYL